MPATNQSAAVTPPVRWPDLADIAAAARRLDGVAVRTPMQHSPRLSAQFSRPVFLKREDLQPVRSYKLRGAYNSIATLVEAAAVPAGGVICASAGNHGQGVAWAAEHREVRCTVVVPSTTPHQKRSRIRQIGGSWVTLEVAGREYDEAAAHAASRATEIDAILIPPFDDAAVIAGQGTVGAEIVDELAGRDATIVVGVGGGGLAAGISVAIRAHPELSLHGVEPAGAASMVAALAHGAPVRLDTLDTFVDGAAVRQAGALTTAVLAGSGIVMHVVPTGAVCVEMLGLYQHEGIIAEPAGALGVAALSMLEPGDSTVVVVITGGNNDITRYAEISEMALVFAGLKQYFLVEFPQEPGALRGFLDDVLGPNDDIALFEYVKRSNRETGPALVGIELAFAGDLHGLLDRMSASPLHIETVDADSPWYRYIQ